MSLHCNNTLTLATTELKIWPLVEPNCQLLLQVRQLSTMPHCALLKQWNCFVTHSTANE